MRKKRPLLSLCIPTYGVCEWVFPCLDCIYGLCYPDTQTTFRPATGDAQKLNSATPEDLYEVIITDNGHNEAFERRIAEYQKGHSNLVYKKTAVSGFLNEAESYKEAGGLFIKFINHRSLMRPGALQYLIDFVRHYQDADREDIPFIYFLNGAGKQHENIRFCRSFDDFVRGLSIWSSWSTGMGFWKDDFDALEKDSPFNELFPHTTVLFSQRKKKNYIIDNTVLLSELSPGRMPKGAYDLYYAFGVEYTALLCDLLRSKDITLRTFGAVKKENLRFIENLYLDYNVLHRYCSYDISNFTDTVNVFYNARKVKRDMIGLLIKKTVRKVLRNALTLFRRIRPDPAPLKYERLAVTRGGGK